MTVSAILNKIIYSGNGATTVFPFTFPGVVAADIQVYSTSAAGVITLVSTSLYTLLLTAPASPNPTGAGGSVTMGVAPASGTLLTIIRTMPLTQATSLANQGTLYQSVVEAAIDNVLLQIQQLNELLGRQLAVAVSDSAVADLPPAAQRANKFLAFDSSGNPIAATTVTGTAVSSPMIPVVSAASLAAGRTAFGLGALATEGIGAGLEDNGAGLLRVKFTPVADAGNQSVVASFHLTERHATGTLTYTLAKISTLFAGFGLWVYALTGPITFAVDAADNFSGMSAGTSFVIPVGSKAYISADGTSTWFASVSQLYSFGVTNNLQLNCTVSGNNLTVAIKDRNGNDPSTVSPVVLVFRDPTIANGGPVYIAITGATSVVVPNGGTLGTANSTAFRLWIVGFNDAGTFRLGLINALSGTSIYPLGQVPIASSTLVGAGSTSAQVFYTNGAGATSKSYVILGYATWESGLATAGTWSSGPTRIQLFAPTTPLSGQVIQRQGNTTGAMATGATALPQDDTIPQITEGDQFMTQAITPTSGSNLLRIRFVGYFANASGIAGTTVALFQDATANALATTLQALLAGDPANAVLEYYMLAGTIVSTTFRIREGSSSGTNTFNGIAGARLYGGTLASILSVEEIMA